MQIYSLPDGGTVGGAARRCGQSWPNGSSLSTSRDCKWGSECPAFSASIPQLRCPLARHRTPNCSLGAAA